MYYWELTGEYVANFMVIVCEGFSCNSMTSANWIVEWNWNKDIPRSESMNYYTTLYTGFCPQFDRNSLQIIGMWVNDLSFTLQFMATGVVADW